MVTYHRQALEITFETRTISKDFLLMSVYCMSQFLFLIKFQAHIKWHDAKISKTKLYLYVFIKWRKNTHFGFSEKQGP